MKTLVLTTMAFIGSIAWISCNRANASDKCVDLSTGETITVVQDSTTGELINVETGKRVNLVVNKRTRDTIYGPTGEVVNNKITRTEEGVYVYNAKIKNDGDEYKVKGEDYKRKVDDDGDVKIKSGDRKIKIDGETGERKIK